MFIHIHIFIYDVGLFIDSSLCTISTGMSLTSSILPGAAKSHIEMNCAVYEHFFSLVNLDWLVLLLIGLLHDCVFVCVCVFLLPLWWLNVIIQPLIASHKFSDQCFQYPGKSTNGPKIAYFFSLRPEVEVQRSSFSCFRSLFHARDAATEMNGSVADSLICPWHDTITVYLRFSDARSIGPRSCRTTAMSGSVMYDGVWPSSLVNQQI